MNIFILTQEYAPEEVSSAVLAQELAEDLVRRGHGVTVVTKDVPPGVIVAGNPARVMGNVTGL